MSKSILYLGGFELPDKNAAAQRVMANAKLLREMGFDVSFIGISKDIDNAPHIVDGFASNPVPYPSNTIEWMHQIFTFVSKTEILKRKPDYVVLYNFPAFASLRILKFCHKHDIKVVHDLTEWESARGWSPSNIMRKIDINLRMRYCMKKMDVVICISRFLFDYYKRHTKCILVPPTLDLKNPKWDRDRKFTSDGSIKLIYAGTAGFGNKDRLDCIVDAMIGKKNLELTVIGMTKEQYVEGYGKNIPESVQVNFRGRVPHTEAVKAVQQSDFQMLIRDSNLKNNAGFPTKFVESMSCCTPIIATLTSNIGDYLQDGVNGFIVSDEHPLGEVLKKAASLSSAEKIKMKEACKSFEGFDYHSYKDEFSKIFK